MYVYHNEKPTVMDNLLENLKRYFETTPREEVLEDWEKTKAYDAVGITVSELL